jgi:hypothetical protein
MRYALLGLVFVPLILVFLWGIVQSRREQKRLIEQIKRDQALIERINRIGGGR